MGSGKGKLEGPYTPGLIPVEWYAGNIALVLNFWFASTLLTEPFVILPEVISLNNLLSENVRIMLYASVYLTNAVSPAFGTYSPLTLSLTIASPVIASVTVASVNASSKSK